ncbi:11009_t:CDS:2 [Paraglomus brasilianum]|uniref:11009_t:CDS:1 n=1 Tax=Paraglomus brasilianum TaxID=144538 RepID=A0A9N9AG62_9GLOM|nr:11009_t:CDS:2 [Paraglomus brasilianum]
MDLYSEISRLALTKGDKTALRRYFTKNSTHKTEAIAALSTCEDDDDRILLFHIFTDQYARPQVTSQLGKVKRPLEEQHENVTKVLKLDSPSSVAEHYDYTNEELELQTGHCAWTIELIEIMAKVYDVEDLRLQAFRDHTTSLTGQFSIVENEDKSKSDGILQTITTSGQIGLRVILAMKNEIGRGRSDPTIQAALSYAKYWAQPQRKHVRASCCCPSLLLAIAGPWVCVLGGIYTTKPVISPITDFIPLVPIPDERHFHRIARLFEAIRLAAQYLDNYYRTLSIVYNSTTQPLYPYPHQYVTESNTFSQRYNTYAHNLCAQERLAPRLFYVSKEKFGGWYMIIMEYVEGETLNTLQSDKTEYDNVLKCVRKAIHILHCKDIVFGDLRKSNIMVMNSDKGCHGMLIDFDWAGEHGKDRYTSKINPDIRWPTGVEGNAIMDKTHDLYWLDKLEENE